VDTVERKIGVGGGKRGLVRVLALDERAARGVAVDDDFKGVVVEVGAGKIPAVFAGLEEKVETVQARDPADAHADIEVLGVGFLLAAGIVGELFVGDGVTVGGEGPVGGVAVEAGFWLAGNRKILEAVSGWSKARASGKRKSETTARAARAGNAACWCSP
jgi:hypothetical protein